MSGVFVRLDWLTGLKIAIGGTLIFWSNSTLAQVTPDTTLGAEGSVVTPNVEIKGVVSDRVDGGAIRGANLFHSFQEFNVGEGRGVYFSNPQGIENILSRVTGANRSEILGRLGVLGNANLFLLNPSGIVFGQNASLDVEGSFVATTAEAIALGEQGYFSATQPQQSSLLSVSPGALFFNQAAAQPGNIIHGGNLSAGKDLTLAANNLDLQGQLVTGGDLDLQATDTVRIRDNVATPFLARSGENLTIVGNQGIDILALNHPTQTPFVSGGNLNLISDGIVSGDARFASGGSFSIHSLSGGLANFVSFYDPIISSNGNVDVAANYTGASLLVESKGNIRFRGNINITRPDTSALPGGEDTETLSKSTALIMRSGQNTLAYGGVNSGSVPAFASGDVPEGITIGGDVTLRQFNGAGGLVSLTTAFGDVRTQRIVTNGGAININSAGAITTNEQNLVTYNGAKDGGDISLKADNGNIATGNLFSDSESNSDSTANGGNISLKAANGSITSTGLYSSSRSNSGNSGNGGAITLEAAKDISIRSALNSSSYSYSFNARNGGAITLKSSQGSIYTDSINSSANSSSRIGATGGEINLSATNGSISSGGLSTNGGAITLTATNGSIKNEYSSTDGGAITFTATNGNITTISDLNSSRSSGGNGGAITLTATNGKISNSGFVGLNSSSRSSGGNGGAITLTATNGNISITDVASASIDGGGNGGAITLKATNGSIKANALASLSSSFRQNAGGKGGAISLNASKTINIFSINSTGSLGSGDITIFSEDAFTLDNRSCITSDTFGPGKGGDIQITAPSISLLNGAQLSANTHSSGLGGNITLNASEEVKLSGATTTTPDGIFGEAYSLIGLPEGRYLGGYIPTGETGTPKTNTLFPSGLFTQTTKQSTGSTGTIRIDTGKLIVENQAAIAATRWGNSSNEGGRISVNAADSIIVDSGSILSGIAGDASGNSGSVDLQTRVLSITAGGVVQTQTLGKGNAGNIQVSATDAVSISGAGSGLRSGSGGSNELLGDTSNKIGKDEDINVTADRLIVPDKTVLDDYDEGETDDMVIDVPEIEPFDSTDDLFAQTTSETDVGGFDLQPGNTDQTLTINFQDGAQVSAETSGGSNELLRDTSSKIGQGGDINITTNLLSIANGAVLDAKTQTNSQGGDIAVVAETLTIENGGQLLTSTSGDGQAGDITVNASEIKLFGSTSGLFAQTDSNGKAGNVNISTQQLTLTDEARISAATSNKGQGGSITVTAPKFVSFGGNSRLSVETSGTGAAGDVTINTHRFSTQDSVKVSASTSNRGQGGSITVTAPESVILSGNSQLSVETTGAGKAGNVNINTDLLTVEKQASISATSTASATTSEQGGSVTLSANRINLVGQVGIFAETEGDVPAGSLTLQPYNNGQTLDVNFAEGAKISASTSGRGQGGSLIVKAPESVTLRGDGQLAVETSNTGRAGDATINTRKLTIQDGAKISASTSGSGRGGSITVKAPEAVTLVNNGQLVVETSGSGSAGNVTIKNTSSLTIQDGAKVSVSTAPNSSGQGGNIDIQSSSLTLNKGEISARTQGVGNGGNITIDVIGLFSATDSEIVTSATRTSAGAIAITAGDIRLYGDSDITTNVETGTGGGGDITLNANSIIAFDDSDILAFARDGKGGNINLNTPAFFGQNYQKASSALVSDNFDGNNRVDINASGAISSGEVTVPDTSFIQESLSELPENVIDTGSLIANSCIAGGSHQQDGTFVITGSGGLPSRPGEALMSQYTFGTARTVSNTVPSANSPRRPWQKGDPIVEPQGVYQLSSGQLVLSRECAE